MATGRSNQVNKQIGEYLVACELARRGLLVATFSGNVPDLDLLATNATGASLPLQIKTIRGEAWQFSADKFVQVRFVGKRQVLGAKVRPRIPHLLCVLVLATEYGKDRFFILEWEQLRNLAVSDYRAWLVKHHGVRPRNYRSLHCSLTSRHLAKFEDQWETITERL